MIHSGHVILVFLRLLGCSCQSLLTHDQAWNAHFPCSCLACPHLRLILGSGHFAPAEVWAGNLNACCFSLSKLLQKSGMWHCIRKNNNPDLTLGKESLVCLQVSSWIRLDSDGFDTSRLNFQQWLDHSIWLASEQPLSPWGSRHRVGHFRHSHRGVVWMGKGLEW